MTDPTGNTAETGYLYRLLKQNYTKHFIYSQHDKKRRAKKPETDASFFIFRDLRALEGYQTLLVKVLPSYKLFMFTYRALYFLFHA